MGVCVSGAKVAGFSVGGKPVAGLAANGSTLFRGQRLTARFRHGANDFHGMSDCHSCSPPLTTRIKQTTAPPRAGLFRREM